MTDQLIIFTIILLAITPAVIFSYAVQQATITHQMNQIDVLRDEICRLNKIIEDLKENQRACWFPSVAQQHRPNLGF